MYQAADFAASGLNKARESAKRGGFFEVDPEAAPTPPLHDGVEGEEGDPTATPYQTVMDGTWDVLPAGLKATPFESDYPNIEYGQFIKDCLRNIASALEVSYISLGNDLSDVNYSSGQLGLGDDEAAVGAQVRAHVKYAIASNATLQGDPEGIDDSGIQFIVNSQIDTLATG
jgi:capsid protein